MHTHSPTRLPAWDLYNMATLYLTRTRLFITFDSTQVLHLRFSYTYMLAYIHPVDTQPSRCVMLGQVDRTVVTEMLHTWASFPLSSDSSLLSRTWVFRAPTTFKPSFTGRVTMWEGGWQCTVRVRKGGCECPLQLLLFTIILVNNYPICRRLEKRWNWGMRMRELLCVKPMCTLCVFVNVCVCVCV